jgi:hypothetical protein
MKCWIIIDGESAKELFAVGGKDLVNYFLPKQLGVKSKDIVSIDFEELRRDGKVITLADAVLGNKPYEIIKSKDSYKRKELNSLVEGGK